jgi:hypothetical protein
VNLCAPRGNAPRPRLGRTALAAALALAFLTGASQAGDAPAPATGTAPGRPVLNSAQGRTDGVPFGPGESLRFSIEYGLIKAGTAWLEVAPMEHYRGRDCYHLVSRAESNDVMSKIYKVRDRIDSLIDAEGLYSYRYKKRIREGTYKKDFDIAYDPEAGRATYADGRKMDMTPWSKDALSAFYYVRHIPLEVGKDVTLAHHSDGASTDIIVKVVGKEKVTVPAGTFDCIVIEPVMESGGLFKNSGKLTIWITDDNRRMPVLMKSKIPVGSIDAVLQEFRPGGSAEGPRADAVPTTASGS